MMENKMKHILLLCSFFTLAFILFSCSSTKESTKEEPPSPPLPLVKRPTVPDINIRMASIDLSTVSRKIEKTDIEQMAKILKENKIDIFAVQGVTRYPELKSRIDIVDEIAASTEMRKAFGENINISGRQTGNAVFSTYPIRSNDNTRYDHIRSANFESALQAVIDCGAKDVVVVSTHLPEKASIEDQSACINTLSSFRTMYTSQPIVLIGNLPKSEVLQNLSGYENSSRSKNLEGPNFWFSGERWITLLHQNVETTPLGQLAIAEFGIYGKPHT